MAESHKFDDWGPTCEEMMKSHFPLHRACRDGDVEALSMLLLDAQHGVYVEDCFYGWSPAHWASYFGKLACLRKLMQVTRVGVDCDVKSSRFLQTPTHLAAFGGHPHCLQWLIQSGAAIDLQDYLGETPAHKTGRTGSMECASLLVSHGARLYIKNNSRALPHELANNCGFKECAKFMEAACKRQESDSKGVYETQPENTHPTPSPHDVTAAAAVNGTAPHVNGVVDHGGGGDCEMVEEDMEVLSQESYTDGALSRLFAQGDASSAINADVTVNRAICINQAPVAGCKRLREDVEENSFKRQRTTGGMGSLPCEHPSLYISPAPSATHSTDNSYLLDTNMNTYLVEMDTDTVTDTNDPISASDNELPYQNILSLSCEPMKPVGVIPENLSTDPQYWAIIV